MRSGIIFQSCVAVALIICSCGGSKNLTKDYGSVEETTSIYPKVIEDLMNKKYKESIKAVGTANSPDLEIARKKAQNDAFDQIGRQFKQEVSWWDKRFQQELNGQKLEDFRSTTGNFGYITLQGAQPVKEVVSKGKDGYRVYVLVIVTVETMKNLMQEKLNSITEIQATNAYKELDARVAREKAALAENPNQ